MKAILFLLSASQLVMAGNAEAQSLPPAKVSYDSYEALVAAVKPHREQRLVNLGRFLDMSREQNTIILDTRSAEMYKRKHIKGALHLSFSDFTQESLAALIPGRSTRILIYCNNNIEGDPVVFATKAVMPALAGPETKPITLALNIPTYINLFGYGYTNVFELSELVPAGHAGLEFEGTDVDHRKTFQHHKK